MLQVYLQQDIPSNAGLGSHFNVRSFLYLLVGFYYQVSRFNKILYLQHSMRAHSK